MHPVTTLKNASTAALESKHMIASLAVGIKMHVPVHHLITVTGIKAPGICMVNKLASKAEARHQKGM